MQVIITIPDDKVNKVVRAFGLDNDEFYPTAQAKKTAFINILIAHIRNRVKDRELADLKSSIAIDETITGV